jgi:hypothetical protein
MCPQTTELVLLYGCLNQHLTERYLCELHVALYKAVTVNTLCEYCGEPYAEWMVGIIK